MDAPAWRREVAKRRRGGIWPFLTIFFLILVLHCVAILLFTRGFLLTRTELPHYSNCSDVSQSPCVQPPPSLPNKEDAYCRNATLNKQHCWTKPAIDHLVIIVLDALRFDFVAPIPSFEDIKPWMGKLQVLHKLASREGSSARIFKAIADPPTTSLQRLKGLTTGGLPTFIDVGNSFGAPAILEDNLISQLVRNGKQVVMMGDDTWLQLFPHHFNVSFPFPSFNVKDLHTVDDGCTRHLFPSLYDEDWDVLIAHFLGVDHAGHIFGVNSIPMIEKLEQYNVLLEAIVEVLEGQSGPGGLHENTLLLVMGDHGQTINGDHGGGSAEEVETVIFAMGFKDPPSSLTLERDTSSCQLDVDGRMFCINSMQQIDFAVTVAALLGVPFPFGSIGSVNPELYALAAGTWNLKRSSNDVFQNHSITEEWMQNYVNVLCMNSWQAFVFVLLVSVLRFCIELGPSKQAVSSGLADLCPSWMLAVSESYPFWRHIAELLPVLALIILAYMLHESISRSSCRRFLKNVIRGTIFSYLLIAAYWTSESKLLNLPPMRIDMQRHYIPKVIYMIGFGQLSSLALLQFLSEEKTSSWKETVAIKIVAVLSAWSSTIIILSGRQGPMVALASMAGGWCIMRLECLEQDSENGHLQTLSLSSFPVSQWSLLAVCLFFCSGHWCAFDGLHYAAAFIGFEEFILVPQAILLSIDTFGFSHILPIFGLPFLAIQQVPSGQGEQQKRFFLMQLCQVYLMYGLITATTATFTMLCVAIQRRHLMVWGLFAPKFVFDAVGLMLTDFLIFVALLYYCVWVDDDGPRHQITDK
ncbi:uncharacterized protein LOC131303578 isoform X3 [Rhododendron vialii]|uniref:uncharacterized protein LOC131303578 isoform X3 n=1 Tax=Rhododendron vialii TaxID=182163 RepID=UPI00265DDBA2|nr:uncharacterized protein LOC131303578 isoform X3 [Rhododendron vialii]